MVSAGESQSWSEIRMTMRRHKPHHGLVTIIHRTVRGQKHWDRRLDVAVFDLTAVDGDPDDLLDCLEAALHALRAVRRQRG